MFSNKRQAPGGCAQPVAPATTSDLVSRMQPVTTTHTLYLLTLCSLPRTILLSVISLLNEPNTFSPANVDASVMYRKWKESKGKDREYTDIIR